MTLTAIFSILNNVSIRRNICLNFRMFTSENKPLFWQKWTTDVFSYFRPPCWCPCTWAPTWRPILISINLCETLCQITRVWNTAQTWGLDRVLIYIPSIACKFLDFIHSMVFDFYFDGVTVKTGNWKLLAGGEGAWGGLTGTQMRVAFDLLENSGRSTWTLLTVLGRTEMGFRVKDFKGGRDF